MQEKEKLKMKHARSDAVPDLLTRSTDSSRLRFLLLLLRTERKLKVEVYDALLL